MVTASKKRSKLRCTTGNFQCGGRCSPISYRNSKGVTAYTNCRKNAEGMPKSGLEWLERVDRRRKKVEGKFGGKFTTDDRGRVISKSGDIPKAIGDRQSTPKQSTALAEFDKLSDKEMPVLGTKVRKQDVQDQLREYRKLGHDVPRLNSNVKALEQALHDIELSIEVAISEGLEPHPKKQKGIDPNTGAKLSQKPLTGTRAKYEAYKKTTKNPIAYDAWREKSLRERAVEGNKRLSKKLKDAGEETRSVSVRGGSNPQPFEPNYVGRMSPNDLNFDPNRFQYKIVHGATGSSGSLDGVRKWNYDAEGLLMVWKDPGDGKTYVVNGHNRANLAKKLGVESVPIKFLNAKSANEARASGAIANIAEGRGTPLDAAKFFRDSGITREQLTNIGIPMGEAIATKGVALASLPEHLFTQVYMGSMPVERAVSIGCCGLSHTEQTALSQMIESQEKKGRNVTNAVIGELVDTIKASSTVQTQTLDLFGSSVAEQSLAMEVASLQALVKRRLGRDKKLFGTVGRSTAAKDLERGGNAINIDQSVKIAEQAEIGLRVFDQLKNTTSPVSTILNDGARRIANGEPRKTVEQEIYSEIGKILPSLVRGGDATGRTNRQGVSGGSGSDENQVSLFSERGSILAFAERRAERRKTIRRSMSRHGR